MHDDHDQTWKFLTQFKPFPRFTTEHHDCNHWNHFSDCSYGVQWRIAEYLFVWQKYLKSTWASTKYFCLQVQVSTKYFWVSQDQVQVSTKYLILGIKYQVPSTSTLLDPNPGIGITKSRQVIMKIMIGSLGVAMSYLVVKILHYIAAPCTHLVNMSVESNDIVSLDDFALSSYAKKWKMVWLDQMASPSHANLWKLFYFLLPEETYSPKACVSSRVVPSGLSAWHPQLVKRLYCLQELTP